MKSLMFLQVLWEKVLCSALNIFIIGAFPGTVRLFRKPPRCFVTAAFSREFQALLALGPCFSHTPERNKSISKLLHFILPYRQKKSEIILKRTCVFSISCCICYMLYMYLQNNGSNVRMTTDFLTRQWTYTGWNVCQHFYCIGDIKKRGGNLRSAWENIFIHLNMILCLWTPMFS